MSGRRNLLGMVAAAAIAPQASASVPAAGAVDRPATLEDYAALRFDAVPGIAAALGDRVHWMDGAAEWWVTMCLSVRVLERDHNQLAAGMTGNLIEAHLNLAQDAGKVADYLSGCVEALRAAEVRIMAAAARACVQTGEV